MKPIDDWRTVAWRSATTWVTAVVHFVFAIFGVHWAVLLGVLPFMPFELRLPLAMLIAATAAESDVISHGGGHLVGGATNPADFIAFVKRAVPGA